MPNRTDHQRPSRRHRRSALTLIASMAAGSAFVLLAIAAVDLAVAGRWLDLALLAFGITLLVAAQLLQIKSRRDVAASVASPSQDHGDLPSPRA